MRTPHRLYMSCEPEKSGSPRKSSASIASSRLLCGDASAYRKNIDEVRCEFDGLKPRK
jgi:hypothetical protein